MAWSPILADRTLRAAPAALLHLPALKNIVILISGRGSNMEAIVRSCAAEEWPARVVAVVSNRPDAAGLKFAAEQGIATAALDHRVFASRDLFDAELVRVVEGFAPDLVALAGFMRILGSECVRRFEGRMLNIHPSLLPMFPGLHTHQRAIDAGCKLAGATVHFVTPELDHGPIVLQSVVPLRPGDDAQALSQRVLATEHVIYPRAVRWFVQGTLCVDRGVVIHAGGEPQLLL
jgi:phosphoribosylglycinamide formyltransferase-1